AHQKEFSLAIVPNREGKHAAEPIDQAFDPPGPVAVNQNLRVGFTDEGVSRADEVAPEFVEVVHRAVEDDPNGAIGRQHRLMSGFAQIEDGEASVAQRGIAPVGRTLAVRAAPGERPEHRRKKPRIRSASNRARDATHYRPPAPDDAALWPAVHADARTPSLIAPAIKLAP